MNKAVSVICIVLSLILLALFGFGVYVFLESINYFHNWPSDFWVTVDGNRYYVSGDELSVFDKPIQVHYLVDWLSKKQGYNYKIVPTGKDFTYLVDGNAHKYLELEDLTPAFDVREYSNGVIIHYSGQTVSNVLQSLYPDNTVTIVNLPEDNFRYKLILTSIDGKTVELTFRSGISADNIELDPPSVLF